MELALSLGDTSKPFKFLEKTSLLSSSSTTNSNKQQELGFCMASSINNNTAVVEKERRLVSSSSTDSVPIQLNLLPFSPVPRSHNNNINPSSSSQFRFPWLTHNFVNNVTGTADGGSDTVLSPNSAASSFQMEFGINGRGINHKRDHNNAELVSENERGSSRASDDDENGSTRKKLRLSKEQSAFLEESFKEHNTLNPKQKLALANQLNLRPRQVEVWFQNRRARTKLKQTEVDCEYLKRCCETLTEENRRLQKEVQELRALKTSQPFFMQLPATTLTMCPSCERVSTSTTVTATTSTTTKATVATNNGSTTKGLLSLSPNKTTNNLFPSKGQDQNQQSTSN